MNLIVNDKALKRALEVAPEAVITSINHSLKRTAIATQGFFVREMPAGATGNLRRSVTFKFNNRLSVRVEPQANYADYVELGTRPHFPPISAITPWARIKGLNPYAVAMGIAKHGTRAHPFEAKVATQTEGFGLTDMRNTVQRTLNEVI